MAAPTLPAVLAGREDDIQRIAALLEQSPDALLLTAPPLRGLTALLGALQQRTEADAIPMISADARTAIDATDLARTLAVSAVQVFAPPALEWWTRQTPPGTPATVAAYRQLSIAANAAGVDPFFLSSSGGDSDGPRVLQDTLRLISALAPGRVIVAIDHADVVFQRRFDRAPPVALSGALRSSIQGLPNLQLLLAGHQDGPAEQAVRRRKDPLFAGAQVLSLRALTGGELASALRGVAELETMQPATIAAACDVASGVPALAVDLLAAVRVLAAERGGEHPGLVLDAFITLVAANQPRLALTVELARQLHRLGPAILRSVAVGVPPYQLAENSKLVFDALRRLSDAGITWQPQLRTWALSDPLLRAWLRRERWTAGQPAPLSRPA